MSLTTSFPKAVEWRKWDLHVHTPYSLVQHYTGENIEARWEQFLLYLESLPSGFKMIGINDCLYIDGAEEKLEKSRKLVVAELDRRQREETIPVLQFIPSPKILAEEEANVCVKRHLYY